MKGHGFRKKDNSRLLVTDCCLLYAEVLARRLGSTNGKITLANLIFMAYFDIQQSVDVVLSSTLTWLQGGLAKCDHLSILRFSYSLVHASHKNPTTITDDKGNTFVLTTYTSEVPVRARQMAQTESGLLFVGSRQGRGNLYAVVAPN